MAFRASPHAASQLKRLRALAATYAPGLGRPSAPALPCAPLPRLLVSYAAPSRSSRASAASGSRAASRPSRRDQRTSARRLGPAAHRGGGRGMASRFWAVSCHNNMASSRMGGRYVRTPRPPRVAASLRRRVPPASSQRRCVAASPHTGCQLIEGGQLRLTAVHCRPCSAIIPPLTLPAPPPARREIMRVALGSASGKWRAAAGRRTWDAPRSSGPALRRPAPRPPPESEHIAWRRGERVCNCATRRTETTDEATPRLATPRHVAVRRSAPAPAAPASAGASLRGGHALPATCARR